MSTVRTAPTGISGKRHGAPWMSVTPHSGLLGVSEPYELGHSRLQRCGKRLQILGVNEIDAEPGRPALSLARQARSAQYMPLGGDHVGARSEAQEERDRRGHARTGNECSGRALPGLLMTASRLAHRLVEPKAAVRIAAAIKIVAIALEGRGEMGSAATMARVRSSVHGPQRLGGESAWTLRIEALS